MRLSGAEFFTLCAHDFEAQFVPVASNLGLAPALAHIQIGSFLSSVRGPCYFCKPSVPWRSHSSLSDPDSTARRRHRPCAQLGMSLWSKVDGAMQTDGLFLARRGRGWLSGWAACCSRSSTLTCKTHFFLIMQFMVPCSWHFTFPEYKRASLQPINHCTSICLVIVDICRNGYYLMFDLCGI